MFNLAVITGALGGQKTASDLIKNVRDGVKPRRSREMTHFCSFRLTHTKNRFARGQKSPPSNIIHAAGVRGAFTSSAYRRARTPLTSRRRQNLVLEHTG